MRIGFLKIHFIIFFMLTLVLLNLPGQSQTMALKVRIISSDAILYLNPTEDSLEIMKLPIGSVCEVIGSTEEWYKIETPPDKSGITINGYVLQDLTEILNQDEIQPVPSLAQEKLDVLPAQTMKTAGSKGGIKIGVGLSGGYSLRSNSNHKDGPILGASFLLIPIKYFALELNSSFSRSLTENNVDDLSDGKLSSVEIGLNLIGRLPIKEMFIPYISAGGLYSINSFELDAALINSWDDLGFDIDETVENAFGAVFGAGFEIAVTGKLCLGLDFKYRLIKAGGEWTFKDQLSYTVTNGTMSQLNLDTAVIIFGIKYFF